MSAIKATCFVLLSICCLATAASAADRYWVASGATNWNDTANWSTSSGGGSGASVPGSSDKAIFDDGGAGDCTIDINVDVGGISIVSNYTGTISQGAQEVVVGTDHFTQEGGTYTCGTGELKVHTFRLDGGTFTAPSSLLEVGATVTSSSVTDFVRIDPAASTFNHNDGRIRFVPTAGVNGDREVTININSGEWVVYHLDYRGGQRASGTDWDYKYTLGASDTIVVEGDLLLSPSTESNDYYRDQWRHEPIAREFDSGQ